MASELSDHPNMEACLSFLAAHDWIYNYQLTRFFVDRVWDHIPPEWEPVLVSLTTDELNQLPFGLCKDSWPSSLKTFLQKCLQFSVDRAQIQLDFPDIVSHIRRGMSPKKQHEVVCLSALVHDLVRRTDCDVIVDVGSGLGYLGQQLHTQWGHTVVGLECKASHTAGAEKRTARQASCTCGRLQNVTFELHTGDRSVAELENLIHTLNDKMHLCENSGLDMPCSKCKDLRSESVFSNSYRQECCKVLKMRTDQSEPCRMSPDDDNQVNRAQAEAGIKCDTGSGQIRLLSVNNIGTKSSVGLGDALSGNDRDHQISCGGNSHFQTKCIAVEKDRCSKPCLLRGITDHGVKLQNYPSSKNNDFSVCDNEVHVMRKEQSDLDEHDSYLFACDKNSLLLSGVCDQTHDRESLLRKDERQLYDNSSAHCTLIDESEGRCVGDVYNVSCEGQQSHSCRKNVNLVTELTASLCNKPRPDYGNAILPSVDSCLPNESVNNDKCNTPEKHNQKCTPSTSVLLPDFCTNVPEDVQMGSPRVCLVGLHCCGDLTPAVMEHFSQLGCVRAMCLVSCCYHRMSCDAESGSIHYFPLSDAGQQSLLCVKKDFENWTLGTYGLRLAAQETRSRWREQSEEQHEFHKRNVAYRGILELFLHTENIQPEKLVRKLARKSDLQDFDSYIQAALGRFNMETDDSEEYKTKLFQLYEDYKCTFQYIEPLTALQVLLQPVLETLIYHDRRNWLLERRFYCDIVPVFDENISPRNLALIAVKRS